MNEMKSHRERSRKRNDLSVEVHIEAHKVRTHFSSYRKTNLNKKQNKKKVEIEMQFDKLRRDVNQNKWEVSVVHCFTCELSAVCRTQTTNERRKEKCISFENDKQPNRVSWAHISLRWSGSVRRASLFYRICSFTVARQPSNHLYIHWMFSFGMVWTRFDFIVVIASYLCCAFFLLY